MERTVKRTTAYKMADGVIIEDRTAAKRHAAWLDLLDLLRPIVSYCYDSSTPDIDEDIAASVVEHIDTWRDVLRRNPQRYGGSAAEEQSE